MRKKRHNSFLYIISLRWLLELPILFYKKCVSPLLVSRCGYYPSCSTYMLDCLRRHGVVVGLFLGTKRLFRCTPLSKGGYDPVPDKKGDYKWLY